MGLNAYLEGVASVGKKTAASGTNVTVDIDGKPGKRLAVINYSFKGGGITSPTCYIYGSIENTTGTAASGASTLTISTITGTIASGDTIAYVTDDGKYNYAVASANCTSTLLALDASGAVASAITAGAVFWMGPYNGSGSAQVDLTAAFVATTGSSDIGRFFAKTKGSPLRFRIDGQTSQPVSVDYLTLGYVNI